MTLKYLIAVSDNPFEYIIDVDLFVVHVLAEDVLKSMFTPLISTLVVFPTLSSTWTAKIYLLASSILLNTHSLPVTVKPCFKFPSPYIQTLFLIPEFASLASNFIVTFVPFTSRFVLLIVGGVVST